METIHPEKVTTDDGTATLRHPLFGDTYHSLHGAATESEHVFIRNGLAAAGRDSVRILEAGFGSGLNAWLTLEYARRHGIRIDYRAVERYPVDAETACGLGYTEDTLFADLHRSAWDRELPLAEGFTLTKYAADLTEPGGSGNATPTTWSTSMPSPPPRSRRCGRPTSSDASSVYSHREEPS